MPGFDCKATDTPCRGDYLYGGTNMDDLWNGMWGIMRVHGAQQPGLRSLPDNPARLVTSTVATAPQSRPTPPKATGPGTTCPTTAPVKTFDVVAINQKLVYNSHGDSDPKGLMYVLAEDEAAVKAGTKKPEPLVIRANAGDCVKVSLRNALPELYSMNVNGVGGDPALVLEPTSGTKSGTRVGLHPQLVRSDVRLSDGAAVGFNPDSTAGVGETVSYEWYADTELGATNLLDYGDVRGHRHHGLAAALVVEPQHATYHDPATGAPVRSGTIADVRVPGQEDFRETVLVYQDGLDLRLANGSQVPDKKLADFGPDGQPLPEVHPDGGDVHAGGHGDAGEKGVNYTNAPLHRRLGAAPGYFATFATGDEWSKALSSETLGDPGTPIARSYAGDQMRIRVLGGNRPRQTGFQLEGASWRQEPYDDRVAARRRPGRHRHRQGGQRARPADHLRRPPLGQPDDLRPARRHVGPGPRLPEARRRRRLHPVGPRGGRRPGRRGQRPAAAARAHLRDGRRLRRHRRGRDQGRGGEGDRGRAGAPARHRRDRGPQHGHRSRRRGPASRRGAVPTTSRCRRRPAPRSSATPVVASTSAQTGRPRRWPSV